MQSLQSQPLAYFCGKWIDHAHMQLSVDDIGFRQGVTAVERLRTYRQDVFMLEPHLRRWSKTINVLHLRNLPSEAALVDLVAQLLRRNELYISQQGDVGITMFATPGVSGGTTATFGMHLNPLDHVKIEQRRTFGQPLFVTNVTQQHEATWPRSIKVRSRIHYYLADQLARACDVDASGVLIDSDQTVTETSIANLAIVESDRIVSPPKDQVLEGITQQVIERIARKLSIDWLKQRISVQRFKAATEILCMGTDGGIWFAEIIEGRVIRSRVPGNVYLRLKAGFDRSEF